MVLDLFAGCGGLALGFEAAGFHTHGFEMKSVAVKTYNENLTGKCDEVMLDIGEPDEKGADLIIGGPPCQPFSQIGYQRGKRDPRDGFPIFLDAVSRLQPKIAIIENVRGLLFRNKDYLRQAIEELERFGYAVDARLLNARDYGTPQNRERVVVVASKVGWTWPDAVVSDPVSAGIALGPLATDAPKDARYLTPSMDRYIASYEKKSACVNPRDLHMDRPARTLTCRNLGGATSDMQRIRLPDGRRRMLTTREAARLQGFPDWFNFSGNDYEQVEQIGNSVSPLMSLALARQAMQALEAPNMVRASSKGAVSLLGSATAARVNEAQALLSEAGVSMRALKTDRGRERVALALLAVAHLRPKDPWSAAKSHLDDATVHAMRSREVLQFRVEHYGEKLADASYDDVRRKDLVVLVNAGIVAGSARDAAADMNDGTRGNALTPEALRLLRAFRTPTWDDELAKFRAIQGGIQDRLAKMREMKKVPVNLPGGQVLRLSPGPHNEIQRAVIEEFLSRFSRNPQILYVGDTENKTLILDEAGLRNIGIEPPRRGDRLPDIVAYEKERNWVFLIEAVHSSNPVSPERHAILSKNSTGCTAGRIFVSAFLTRGDFRKWVADIAWETEVWLADAPDHCIHFDGERFLGPYEVPDAE